MKNRLAPTLLALLTVCGSAPLAIAEDRAVASSSPPNILLIISDDQAYGDYSFMGHPHIQTPNIDNLAKESLTFRRGYVPTSLCRPSLATIVTGLYPHQHKITGNDPTPKQNRNRMLRLIDAVDTLPERLGKKGYVSLQTGKWWEGDPKERGFTHAMTHGDPARGGRHGDEGLTIGRKGLTPIAEFLDGPAKAKPFFIWYAPFLPHFPHTPPERLLKKYQPHTDSIHVARYWAMCEWFDETVGELLGIIEDRQLAENTMVIYVCDNGWIQRIDGRFDAPRSKRSPYEGGVRTPIMLRWPGKVKPRFADDLASSIDIVPTVLAAAGVKPKTELPGLDWLQIAEGGVLDRNAVFGAIFEHDIPDVDDPEKGLTHRWIVTHDYKLIDPHKPDRFPRDPTEPRLYKIATDPHEKTPVEAPEKMKELRSRLDAWWTP